eukprot:79798-Rhodomonas_salina.1
MHGDHTGVCTEAGGVQGPGFRVQGPGSRTLDPRRLRGGGFEVTWSWEVMVLRVWAALSCSSRDIIPATCTRSASLSSCAADNACPGEEGKGDKAGRNG